MGGCVEAEEDYSCDCVFYKVLGVFVMRRVAKEFVHLGTGDTVFCALSAGGSETGIHVCSNNKPTVDETDCK